MTRLLVFLLLTFGFANAALAEEQVIRIWGPASMQTISEAWAEGFREQHPEVRFELTMKGSDTAMPGLYSGKADIALMGRENEITDNNGFGRVKGYAPTRIELMRGSMATSGHSPAQVLLVREDNPLAAISMAQIRALFGCDGKTIRTWGELGVQGDWANTPIRLHMPDARSGTGRFFRRAVLGGSNKLNWSAISEYPVGGMQIADAVRADSAAIGVGTMDDTKGLRAIPIIPDAGAMPVPLTSDTLRLGTYPMARRAYAFVDRKRGSEIAPLLAEFLRYTMSPAGQAAVAGSGNWTTVDEATITRNLATLSLPAGNPTLLARQVAAAHPTYSPKAEVSGTIGLWGHGSFKRDFMGRLVKRWFAEFRLYHPEAKLDYRMYGTASAIGALAVDAGNLALLGEEISPESAETFLRAKGYAPTKIEVANGSLATNFFDYAHMIFVHKDNPLAQLSLPQLEGIFGAERKCSGEKGRNIRTWGDLGLTGEWAEKAITPYVWKTDTDFALFLRERALCDSHRWNPATREILVRNKADGTPYDLGQQLIDELAQDKYGIAISNIRFPNPDVNSVALAWDSTRPFVQATETNIINGSYPLTRLIPAYVDQKPGDTMEPVLREFLSYILSREGQIALIEESGYLPLGANAAAHERSKLK